MTTVPRNVVPTGGAARWIGRPVQRKEDQRLITGRGRYIDDIVLPGMLHATFVRSSVARGTISHVDVAAAREFPGVAGVFTAACRASAPLRPHGLGRLCA